MLVYADLYRERNGDYPEKAVLYFLGELDKAGNTLIRPQEALIEVPLDPQRIEIALKTFKNAVVNIESCRLNDDWPAPQPGHEPDKRTCDICDIRWNCSARSNEYPMRYP